MNETDTPPVINQDILFSICFEAVHFVLHGIDINHWLDKKQSVVNNCNAIDNHSGQKFFSKTKTYTFRFWIWYCNIACIDWKTSQFLHADLFHLYLDCLTDQINCRSILSCMSVISRYPIEWLGPGSLTFVLTLSESTALFVSVVPGLLNLIHVYSRNDLEGELAKHPWSYC